MRCKKGTRKCFTGKCVKTNKNKNYNKKRCKRGTRKCSDRNCYKNVISNIKHLLSEYKKHHKTSSSNISKSSNSSKYSSKGISTDNSSKELIQEIEDELEGIKINKKLKIDNDDLNRELENIIDNFNSGKIKSSSKSNTPDLLKDISELERLIGKKSNSSEYSDRSLDSLVDELEQLVGHHEYKRKREPIKKFISPKRKLHKKSYYDLDDLKKSNSSSSKKRKSLKYKFVGKINQNKRQTLDDWSMSDNSNSF
jgi:hypothetical protein